MVFWLFLYGFIGFLCAFVQFCDIFYVNKGSVDNIGNVYIEYMLYLQGEENQGV